MIILTKHCKERIKKRLIKKKSVDPCVIWVTKNKIKGISRDEAKKFIQNLKINTFCVFFNNLERHM